jgi:hypothetical protein
MSSILQNIFSRQWLTGGGVFYTILIMNFSELIKHYGTQVAVAKRLGVTKGAINQWKDNGIPEGRQYQIAMLSGHALKVDEKIGQHEES